MKTATLAFALLYSAHSLAGTDAVVTCRARHADDPAAHIACLENALRDPSEPPRAGAQAVAAASPAERNPAPAVVASATTPTGLGAEQAQARQRASEQHQEQAQVRIVGVRYTATGLGEFTLADGQVWRETVRTPVRLHLDPSLGYDGRIERSTLGGYRMYVDDVRWMHKVERMK